MTIKITKVLIFFVLFTSCRVDAEDVIGEWHKKDFTYLETGVYKIDSIVLTKDKKWEQVSIIYEQDNYLHPIFRMYTSGYWVWEGRNSLNSSFKNIRFGYEKRKITVLTKNKKLVDAFFLNLCSEKSNKEVDISLSGCSVFPPISKVPYTYQIVSILDKKLYLGKTSLIKYWSTPTDRPSELEKEFFHRN